MSEILTRAKLILAFVCVIICSGIFTDAAGAATYQQLKSFESPSSDRGPLAGVIQGTDGALYGTAYQGGPSGYGTVFKLNPDGSGFTVLKNFDFYTTGGELHAGLIQGTDGALYGTAAYGGSSAFPSNSSDDDYDPRSRGGGTVFKLNPDGSGFTVLKHFDYYIGAQLEHRAGAAAAARQQLTVRPISRSRAVSINWCR